MKDEHGEGDMSLPGVVLAELIFIDSDPVLARAEAFLDGPAGDGDGFNEPGVLGL